MCLNDGKTMAPSHLPPQTMLHFKQNEIFFWHKFDGGGGGGGGGEGDQGIDAKPSQKYIFSSSRVPCRN